jgi:hypothetical protein
MRVNGAAVKTVAGKKIPRQQCHAGSIPAPGTIYSPAWIIRIFGRPTFVLAQVKKPQGKPAGRVALTVRAAIVFQPCAPPR